MTSRLCLRQATGTTQLVRGRPASEFSILTVGNTLANLGRPTTCYVPPTVPTPPALEGEEQELAYWRGFSDGVKAVVADVRPALEPQQTTEGAASRGTRVRRPSKSR
jgi:hypothetical protein